VQWRCKACSQAYDLADLLDQLDERTEAALGNLICNRF
jgi:hypothetical protein